MPLIAKVRGLGTLLESSDTSGGKRVWLNAGRSQRSNGLIALLGHRLTMLVDIFFVRFFL